MLVAQDRQRPRRAAEVGPPGRETALAEIYNAEDKTHASVAAKAFATEFGTKWPKAAAKITDDLDVLLAFYDFPAEHWIHLRTTNPIESTFATVRLRQRVTKGPGSRAAGVAMAFKLIESAQTRWRCSTHPTSSRSSVPAPPSSTANSSNDPPTKINKRRSTSSLRHAHPQVLTIPPYLHQRRRATMSCRPCGSSAALRT